MPLAVPRVTCAEHEDKAESVISPSPCKERSAIRRQRETRRLSRVGRERRHLVTHLALRDPCKSGAQFSDLFLGHCQRDPPSWRNSETRSHLLRGRRR